MPLVDIAGQKLFYQERYPLGRTSRGTVLFLHGLGAESSSWGMQLDPLAAAGWHGIAMDFPGFGRSPYSKSHSTPGQLGEISAAFIRRSGRGPCHIVGLSLGGMVALELGTKHPSMVQSLVLANTAAYLRPRRIGVALYYGLRLAMTLSLGKAIQGRLVARRIFPLEAQAYYRKELQDQINRADGRAYRRTLLSLARYDVRAELATLNIPTLVITGARDTTIPPSRQGELARALGSARHEILDGAGHAVPLEQPALFNRLLLDFIESNAD